MQTLAKQVLEYAAGLPEGTPLVAKELLHLGGRAAVDQVLSRLVKRGALLRAGRGIYVLPVESRFGTHAPSTSKMVEGLAVQRGETIVLHGAASSSGRLPHLLEKDIWVVWSLRHLFDGPHADHLVFKGGTSLSKAYGVIRRFSEDVDLTYDIRAIAGDLVGDADVPLPV